MAQITLTIPDAIAPDVVQQFSDYHGYQTHVPNGNGEMVDNPQSRAAFCKEVMRDHIRDVYRIMKGRAAAETAREAAEATAITTTSTIS